MKDLKLRRAGFIALQTIVAVAALSAAAAVFANPACAECITAEVTRGAAAGLLLAALKSIVTLSRPNSPRWYRYVWLVTCRELKAGLAAGFALGVLAAMWIFTR